MMMTDTTTTTTSSSSSAMSAWQAANFAGLQQSMHHTWVTAKQQRESSLASRKALVESTKQFQRHVKSTVGNNETVSLAKDMVKQYQEEIDKLTKRCKTAEQAFASVQQTLEPLQDPSGALQTSLEKQQDQEQQIAQLLQTVQTLTMEVQKEDKKTTTSPTTSSSTPEKDDEILALQQEVAAYEVEFRSLKNQDITIRKLEDRIVELQTGAAVALEQAVQSTRNEFESQLATQSQNAATQLATANSTIARLHSQLASETAFREATQTSLLQTDDGVAQRQAAWDAQRQILMDELVHAQHALQNAVRERDALQWNSNSNNTTTETSPQAQQDVVLERNAYQAEVAELSDTNALLRQELQSKQTEWTQQQQKLEQKVKLAEKQQDTLQNTCYELQSQLESAPSPVQVETMKRELRILKRLEYNAADDGLEPEVVMATESEWEQVLMGKLRQAEKELIQERNEKVAATTHAESLQQALEQAELKKEESVQLVAALEQDLEKALKAAPTKTSKGKSKPAMPQAENPTTLQHIMDSKTPPPSAAAPLLSEKAQDDHSVATIVMAQRDRLRARCEALEAERDSFKRELQAQVQSAESFKVDNTKLYEKVRYLQNSTSAKSSTHQSRDLDLEALEQRYEASVDPFRQFSKTERQRKLKEMSPMERTVYVVAKTVLSTKEMRTGLFFYVLALHLLVFVTTYHWSASACHSSSQHDMERMSMIAPHVQAQLASKKE